MRILSLAVTVVVLLNSVDITLQGQCVALNRNAEGESSPTRFPNDLHEGSLIVADVTFPEGLYYKVYGYQHLPLAQRYRPLAGLKREAVVDPNKNIVAVFLSTLDHMLYAIYRGSEETRVKLTKVSMESNHFQNMDEGGESRFYPEFVHFNKPRNIYRDSFRECGLRAYRQASK